LAQIPYSNGLAMVGPESSMHRAGKHPAVIELSG